ncbi:SANT/Myb_domain [Hexamita inflata]|uniref:SANT/Myb domain n=1 Tax=Hexamita inflata TaxID=28002 RepID=A0AA86UNN9_9EUKA|nr:SANT/Myb domain [Hexamita inflata]CAI9958682.1 SANT/Myb domain [Hexamita inflata]
MKANQLYSKFTHVEFINNQNYQPAEFHDSDIPRFQDPHFRMAFDLPRSILENNLLLLQSIHTVQHQISLHRNKLFVYQRARWSSDEEQLLQSLLAQFGTSDLKRVANVMLSKTQKQIYYKVYQQAQARALSQHE